MECWDTCVVVTGELPCRELWGCLLWSTNGTIETPCGESVELSTEGEQSLELGSSVPEDAQGNRSAWPHELMGTCIMKGPLCIFHNADLSLGVMENDGGRWMM